MGDILRKHDLLAAFGLQKHLQKCLRRQMAEFWHFVGHPLPDEPHEDSIQDIVHLLEAKIEGIEFGRDVVLGVALLELSHTEL